MTPVILTVDVVLFTLHQDNLHVVLLPREHNPYAQQLALPGGYVHPEEDQDTLSAARRMLHSKTGIVSPYLEQLYTFSGRVRDPRGWSVSVAYYALIHQSRLPQEHQRFELHAVDALPELPFDHNRIVQTACKRLRDKSTYSTLPCHLLPSAFTLAELQQTYEKILGTRLDKSVFRRKLNDLDFLEEAEGQRTGAHRPAQLYRLRADCSDATFGKTM